MLFAVSMTERTGASYTRYDRLCSFELDCLASTLLIDAVGVVFYWYLQIRIAMVCVSISSGLLISHNLYIFSLNIFLYFFVASVVSDFT